MALPGLAAAVRPVPSVAAEDDPRCSAGASAMSNKHCVFNMCEGSAKCGGQPGVVGVCSYDRWRPRLCAGIQRADGVSDH